MLELSLYSVTPILAVLTLVWVVIVDWRERRGDKSQ